MHLNCLRFSHTKFCTYLPHKVVAMHWLHTSVFQPNKDSSANYLEMPISELDKQQREKLARHPGVFWGFSSVLITISNTSKKCHQKLYIHTHTGAHIHRKFPPLWTESQGSHYPTRIQSQISWGPSTHRRLCASSSINTEMAKLGRSGNVPQHQKNIIQMSPIKNTY